MSYVTKADLTEAFEEFGQMVKAGFDSIDRRFDKVDQRFDRVESRLDKVETRLDRVETRLNGVEERLEAVESSTDRMERMLRANIDRLDDHGQRIERLEKKVFE